MLFEESPIPGGEMMEYVQRKRLETPQWREELTISSMDKFQSYTPGAFIARISPTPLLMIVTTRDEITPTDLQLASYGEAREPKELVVVDGNHCSVYEDNFETVSTAARDFFLRRL